MTLRYISTRTANTSTDQGLSFADVLLAGLAHDGGLYVPTEVPQLSDLPTHPPRQNTSAGSRDTRAGSRNTRAGSRDTSTSSRNIGASVRNTDESFASGSDYARLATQVMAPYTTGSISYDHLAVMIADAYDCFDHPEVCPLVSLEDDHYLLELFHGPTFAFKDVALQVVARLFDHELERRDSRVTIVGATSGDTGSAAMEAMANRERIDIVILHPAGRTSEIQRRQMTTLTAENVHAVAVDGTFDDCQDLVKAMFADVAFRSESNLAAINSINWARVVAQVVYYIWAHQRLRDTHGKQPITFCVPTGNFGNVLAGHFARRMGLKVNRLLVASNSNDILSRFLQSGELAAHQVVPTLSPSMDIQISSNLERLLFELFDRDGTATASMLAEFRATGRARLSPQQHQHLQSQFAGDRLDDQATLEVMASVHSDTGMFIDPHTAVGVGVARRQRQPGELIVTLATAHPAKFGDAVVAATGSAPDLPPALAAVSQLPERCTFLANDLAEVQSFVRSIRRG